MRYLIFLLLLPFFAQAQEQTAGDVSYKLGPEFKETNGVDGVYYFHKENDIINLDVNVFVGFYIYTIRKIDAQTLAVKSVEVYKNPVNHVFEGVEMVNGKIFLFYSKYKLKPSKEELLADEIDWKTGKLKKIERSILKIEERSFSIEDKFQFDLGAKLEYKLSFDIKQSTDSSKLLIKYWHPEKPAVWLNDLYKGKTYQVRMGFHVLDTDFNPIWNTVTEMPYPARKMEYFDFTLDSYGNIYFLASIFKGAARKTYTNDGKHNRHIEVLKVDAKTQKLSNTKIQLPGYHIHDLALVETAKKKMVCTGFYTEDREIETHLGAFVGEINPADNAVTLKTFSFAQNLRFEGTMSNLEVAQIVTMEDGSIVLFGEERSIIDRGTDLPNIYYFNDLLITRFTPNFTVSWMKGFKKNQGGNSPRQDLGMRYLSYHNNHHYLLYLTHRTNIQKPPNTESIRHKAWFGGYVLAAKISDKNGSFTKQTLFNVDEILPNTRKGLLLRMGDYLYLSNNSLLLGCRKYSEKAMLLKLNVK